MERREGAKMSNSRAIILGAIIIALSIVSTNLYELSTTAQSSGRIAWKINKLTGTTSFCVGQIPTTGVTKVIGC